MKITTMMNCKITFSLLAAALLLSTQALAKDDLPDRTTDGLDRIESKHVDAVYWKEGATLAEYDSIFLVEAAVAFKKDWMRDFNRNAGSLTRRVDAKDMDRIKIALSEEFVKIFTQELQEEGGYELSDSPGENVLVLRPAIINLDITAPDLNSSSRSRTYTASAGAMTLYMELYDSATGAIIGRIIDREEARGNSMISYSDSRSNRLEADKMLRKWSDLLRDALDEAHGK